MIKTIINGANGSMGSLACEHVERDADLTLVARATRSDNLAQLIRETQADVVVDLTDADSVFTNAQLILNAGARPVIGTTGLLAEQISELSALCQKHHTGGIIAPNFSIGAILMMRFAKEAARYMPDVEIIEMHHPLKLDSPSGTSLKTADLIEQGREQHPDFIQGKETIPGARGANHHNIAIHSVRLPGLVAHQTVLFGGHYETLTLRHDTLHRESFMPGILLAVKKAMTINELVYGLENVI